MSAEKIVVRALEAGEAFVATAAQISLEIAPMVAGAVRTLEFRGYRYITEDPDEIKALVEDINSPACPWAVKGEYIKKEDLDPLNAVRRKAVEDYLASVAAAATTASTTDAAAVAAATGIATTTDAAKATAAATKAQLDKAVGLK